MAPSRRRRVTTYLDVTGHTVPQGQGLQLLVGQLRDIVGDVHAAAAAVWRNFVCFVARPIRFSNSSRLIFSAKHRKVAFSAGCAIRIFLGNRGGRGGTNRRRGANRLVPVARSISHWSPACGSLPIARGKIIAPISAAVSGSRAGKRGRKLEEAERGVKLALNDDRTLVRSPSHVYHATIVRWDLTGTRVNHVSRWNYIQGVCIAKKSWLRELRFCLN